MFNTSSIYAPSRQSLSSALSVDFNPEYEQILDMFLVAGYFRARIPSLTAFDKVSFTTDFRRHGLAYHHC
jgi:hypothetical protein